VVFDVLAVAGQDLRGLPYRERRTHLRRLLADTGLPLALTPATRDRVGAQARARQRAATAVMDIGSGDLVDTRWSWTKGSR
jgi:ATP-dependent DNA ligase